MMEPALAPLAAFLRTLTLRAPQIPWVSNLTGKWITAAQATSPDYWTAHVRNTVRFADGVAELVNAGHRVLLEVGPGQTLTQLARQHPAAGAAAATVVASLGAARGEGSDLAATLRALGELWVSGVTPDWRAGFYREERRRLVALPTYPFERKRYWIEPGTAFAPGANTPVPSAVPAATLATDPGSSASEKSEPVASTVETLKQLFQEMSGLDLARASATASLYSLGFDSLFLTQASLAVSRRFGREVTFRQLREELSSLAKLAAHIDAQGAAAPRPGASPAGAGEQAASAKQIPLTDAQREMWFASQLGSAVSTAYNESSTLLLDGPLEEDALRRALHELVGRHEALRTTFSAAGDVQTIAAAGSVELAVCEVSHLPEAARDAAASTRIDEEIQRPFELAGGALFRATLVRLSPDRHVLALTVHHIICDGWSLGIMVRELGELYSAAVAGRRAQLPDAPRFSDYAAKLATVQSTTAFAAAEAFWKKEFADRVPVLDLPLDRPRPANRTYAGGFLLSTLPPEVTAAVKRLCTERDCTPYTLLLAAFNLLLHRLTGQDDVVVGVPSAAQVMDGLENLVGHFANLLPLRSRIDDQPTFAAYLARTREHMTDALEHWRYPFGSLLQQLNLPRDASRVPLAPVVFNTTRRRGKLSFAGLTAEVASNPKRFVNFDLNFNFALTDDALSLGCYFSTELFDEATIARWLGHFETLLRGIAAAPHTRVSELPLLSVAERHHLLVELNDTRMDYPREATVAELFEAQVRRTPDAIAVVSAHERLTYAELDRRAERLAQRLRAAGVQRDAMVGLYLDRSPELLVGILGVLKAGGGYVPLDPAYPRDRLEFMARDTGMKVLVTQRQLLRQLPTSEARALVIDEDRAGEPARVGERSSQPATADSLAYVIYTSGSTGRPKGVCITQRCVVALVAWAGQLYRPEELAGVFFATSASFDISVFEIFCPLCLGGKVVLADSILDLGSHPARSEITFLSGVPSAVAEVVRTQSVPPSVRTVALAGEPFPQPLVDALCALSHIERVFELYGPTETTVYSTGGQRTPANRASLGRPFPNERVYVLDRNLQPVPIGVAGELYIAGDKLARGYLNRPELTAEKFIAAPFLPGERLYRTGDGARFLADGTLEFVGRLDHQVKIRGFRVELGEIEAALAEHSSVGECVVIARPDTSGTPRLLAYVVGAAGRTVEPRSVRESLQQRLPDYMVPSAIVALEKFPLTTNGKLDRGALPEPEFAVDQGRMAPPRTTTEELLVDIWREVLAVERLGIHDNFFELGGHSLLATQVIARVNDSLGVELSMRQFFAAPTVAGLAPSIEAALIEEIRATVEDDANPAADALVTAKE
jgi:amino acid adenylation domain-containing protein